MKSKNGLLFRRDIKYTIREGQTYALIHGVAKFKLKSSIRRDKFKTFSSVCIKGNLLIVSYYTKCTFDYFY